MFQHNNDKMNEQDEHNYRHDKNEIKHETMNETKVEEAIQRKCLIFPQFRDEKNEIEYDMMRIFNINEFIYIHLTMSLSVIMIESLLFSLKLNKKNTSRIELLTVIFFLTNCLIHICILIRIYFSAAKNASNQKMFIVFIVLNQILQFATLYFATKFMNENKKHEDLNYYYSKLCLFIHFFVDSTLILCLPTLKFFLAFIFLSLYLVSNILLTYVGNYGKINHAIDFFYIAILTVLIIMFVLLRYLMEKRNRILLYMIKEFLSDNYKKLCDENKEEVFECTVNIAESNSPNVNIKENKGRERGTEKRGKGEGIMGDKDKQKQKFVISEQSMFFNDVTMDACYKDYYAVFNFLKQLLSNCNKKKNENIDNLNIEEELKKTKQEDATSARSKENENMNNKDKTNHNQQANKSQTEMDEVDILNMANEIEVLKSLKKIDSEELGKNWDYSFIDSEYGKSSLVILEVGYHLINPYLESNEKKRKKLQLFLLLINSMYFPNPYHNANHGATVCHLSKCLAHSTNFDKYLNNTYMISYLIAAIAHDVGHPGRTNAYLSETNHILSIRYNDMSILENYHCSITFSVLRLIGHDFLINSEDNKLVQKNNYASIRKFIIELIIATDMKLHFEYVNIFRKRKKSGNFDLSDRDAINLGTINIKLADIGHTCLKWKDHAKWTMLVSEEFFSQKKIEEIYKQRKIDISSDFRMKEDDLIDDAMSLNYENIYLNYVNNINNVNTYDFSYIKLNFIHNHDFVKNIPGTQVYFFEIIVMPLILELQSMEKDEKDITKKVLHNLTVNLKTWRIIEKNIDLFYNTEKMKTTDYYKNMEKNNLVTGTSLLDIAEEDVLLLSKELSHDKGDNNEEEDMKKKNEKGQTNKRKKKRSNSKSKEKGEHD